MTKQAIHLKLNPEDDRRIHELLDEITDIIARSNGRGLEIDFEYWRATVFGRKSINHRNQIAQIAQIAQ